MDNSKSIISRSLYNFVKLHVIIILSWYKEMEPKQFAHDHVTSESLKQLYTHDMLSALLMQLSLPACWLKTFDTWRCLPQIFLDHLILIH